MYAQAQGALLFAFLLLQFIGWSLLTQQDLDTVIIIKVSLLPVPTGRRLFSGY